MAKTRKKTLNPPRNPWETALEEIEGGDRSQAGEIEAGGENGAEGNKGVDPETGDGGYGGEAVLEGYDDSSVDSERPVDREIHGDPRTHEGESYPDDVVVDPRQGTLDQALDDEEEDRTGGV